MTFDELINKYENEMISEADIPASPDQGMQSAVQPTDALPQPQPQPPQEEQPKQMTPEGKRFVIELALKALAYDPGNIPPQDKGLFDNEVTPENAEEVLTKIEQIVGNDVPSYREEL